MSKVELGADVLPYPKQVIFILGNEFCERFSFYGMKAVLSKYLKDDLQFSENAATAIYHCFGFLAYFTPIFGAILADNYIGKFKTIFYVSIIYVLGHIVKTVGATPPFESGQVAMCFVGLIMIGIGTGGIKPCVASFGGDQFKLPEQGSSLEKFFYVFYLSINIGSLIGVYLTPIFREDIHCFGRESCYPLAFGFPALLMIIALILFLVGRPFYKTVQPPGNILLKVLKIYGRGISKKWNSDEKAEHWLDRAKDKYDHQLVEDSKVLINILILYLPLPIFWTLFDQQGSRWVFQGSKMNSWSNTLGNVKPDQMSIMNPFLIILLIPIFNIAVYPVLNKLGILTKPLHRMFLGGVLAGLAFVASAIVEHMIKNQNSPFYDQSKGSYYIMNASPCKTNVYMTQHGSTLNETSRVYSMEPGALSLLLNETSLPCSSAETTASFDVKAGEFVSALIHGDEDALLITKLKGNNQLRPGYAKTMFISKEKGRLTIGYKGRDEFVEVDTPVANGLFTSQFIQYKIGTYNLTKPDGNKLDSFEIKSINSFAHIYIDSNTNTLKAFEVDGFVDVHIFWQIPQYVLITVGEILFSVTGLEFSYSRAPLSMKAVVQAAWLLTTAFGNLFVMIISGFHPFQQVEEFIFFAILMILCHVVFLVLGYKLGFMKDTPSGPEVYALDKKESETSTF
eukprot:TRINITY_DN3004_c0_g1_i2.p1 TRINITY_DN3004_c0_g1~~TRINITY_DN3004_c0_g1_i2.p1  ORF type:complete len:680 (-),score=104.27 TRINITY_DN3004_c0_g1_i2:119-2158(-)